MSSDQEHDGEPLLIRTVGGITSEDSSVWVDHLYTMETCEHGRLDAGQVGLTVTSGDTTVSVCLIPDDALVIANRIIRAANLVMESGEDLPDPEREYRRHSATGGEDGGT
ncbi:MAG TPA: hypothetical protein VGH27_01645 [Streptosporangiaceae bacterium]